LSDGVQKGPTRGGGRRFTLQLTDFLYGTEMRTLSLTIAECRAAYLRQAGVGEEKNFQRGKSAALIGGPTPLKWDPFVAIPDRTQSSETFTPELDGAGGKGEEWHLTSLADIKGKQFQKRKHRVLDHRVPAAQRSSWPT